MLGHDITDLSYWNEAYYQSWEPQLVAPKIDNTYQTSLNMYHQSWEPQVVAPKHI